MTLWYVQFLDRVIKNTSILVTFVFSYSPALQCVMIVDGL